MLKQPGVAAQITQQTASIEVSTLLPLTLSAIFGAGSVLSLLFYGQFLQMRAKQSAEVAGVLAGYTARVRGVLDAYVPALRSPFDTICNFLAR